MESTRIRAELRPTRRISTRERAVFDRILRDFRHLRPSDAEMLTQYAETVVRYEIAAKETKKQPVVSVPIVNRASGNVTGEKQTRNPAFATLRESQQQMTALARRLMIDAASIESANASRPRRRGWQSNHPLNTSRTTDSANSKSMQSPNANAKSIQRGTATSAQMQSTS